MRSLLTFSVMWLLLIAAGQVLAGGFTPGDAKQVHEQVQLQEGEIIYQQYCAGCHGVQGEGQPNWERQNALGELPAPPHNMEGHTWKHSDAMLYRIISEGWRDPWNKTERLTMPAFGNILTPLQIKLVTNYLKTLWTPEQRQHQKEESVDAPFPLKSQ